MRPTSSPAIAIATHLRPVGANLDLLPESSETANKACEATPTKLLMDSESLAACLHLCVLLIIPKRDQFGLFPKFSEVIIPAFPA